MLEEEERLASAIRNAEKLHGHLGPFLVIGVRMGNVAKRVLNADSEEDNRLRATAKMPLFTPFSCVLDGIQATTRCTVGNQKLRIEDSRERNVTVHFELQNLNRALKISVNPEIIETLMNRISEGASNEELAQETASMPETQLFSIEKR